MSSAGEIIPRTVSSIRMVHPQHGGPLRCVEMRSAHGGEYIVNALLAEADKYE